MATAIMALGSYEFTFLATNFTFNENGTMLENISLVNCARDCANSFCVGFGYRSETRTCFRLTRFHHDCQNCDDIEANVYTYTKGKGFHERNLIFSRLGNVWYSVENITTTWFDATEICQNRGGSLFEITSDELDDFFKDTVFAENDGASIWIGGQCISKESGLLNLLDLFEVLSDTWVWSRTQEPIAVMRWGPGQPDIVGQNCLQYFFDGEFYKWDNEYCLCEKGPVYCQYHD